MREPPPVRPTHRVIIIHGTGGSPSGNWFPWLAAELGKRNVDVIVPKMPTPEGQSLTNWMKAFDEQIGPVDQTSTVVGHSVGAVFLLRLLERLSVPIANSVFVAGFTGVLGAPEFDTLNSSFVADPYRWDVIRHNAGAVLCFSGDDDPYVPLEQGLEIAENLGVTPRIVPNGSHLNAQFGYTTFPLLLEELTKLGISGKNSVK